MQKLSITIGISGSGKTTFRKTLENYKCVSPDDIRRETTGDISNQEKNSEVWIRAYERLRTYLECGFDVIFDSTACNVFTKFSKKDARSLAEHYVTKDEAFMIKDVYKFTKFCGFSKTCEDIFFVGLLASSDCEVFPEVVKLLPRCDEIIKLNAVCMECGTYPANYSYFNGTKEQQIVVGDRQYSCLCRKCYFEKK